MLFDGLVTARIFPNKLEYGNNAKVFKVFNLFTNLAVLLGSEPYHFQYMYVSVPENCS